jgi:hypothetical protein
MHISPPRTGTVEAQTTGRRLQQVTGASVCKLAAVFVFLLIEIVSVRPAFAACVPGFEPARDSSVSYRERDGRCEGLLRQAIAASAHVNIIGVHAHFPQIGASDPRPINVAVAGSTTRPLKLAIVSSRIRHYYRLDAMLDARNRFIWPRDVIQDTKVALTPRDIKGYACEQCDPKKELRLFPISVFDRSPPTSKETTIWLRAALDLKELFISLHMDGRKKPLIDNEDYLGGRILVAGEPVDVIQELPKGVYRFRATAVPARLGAVDEVKATIIIP